MATCVGKESYDFSEEGRQEKVPGRVTAKLQIPKAKMSLVTRRGNKTRDT